MLSSQMVDGPNNPSCAILVLEQDVPQLLGTMSRLNRRRSVRCSDRQVQMLACVKEVEDLYAVRQFVRQKAPVVIDTVGNLHDLEVWSLPQHAGEISCERALERCLPQFWRTRHADHADCFTKSVAEGQRRASDLSISRWPFADGSFGGGCLTHRDGIGSSVHRGEHTIDRDGHADRLVGYDDGIA